MRDPLTLKSQAPMADPDPETDYLLWPDEDQYHEGYSLGSAHDIEAAPFNDRAVQILLTMRNECFSFSRWQQMFRSYRHSAAEELSLMMFRPIPRETDGEELPLRFWFYVPGWNYRMENSLAYVLGFADGLLSQVTETIKLSENAEPTESDLPDFLLSGEILTDDQLAEPMTATDLLSLERRTA